MGILRYLTIFAALGAIISGGIVCAQQIEMPSIELAVGF